MPDILTTQFLISLVQIIWIDLLLSGDNAVVIALACRNLPPEQRRIGIWLGAGAAIGLRIIFALAITYLLAVPFLKIVGGILLFWVAIKLVQGDDAHGDVAAPQSLWGAVRTIAIADAVMSLDNVLAISAASHGDVRLFIFGLLLSIPLIIYGSTMILNLLTRFPVLIWIGAALLGWIAGGMITEDPWFVRQFGKAEGMVRYLDEIIGALFVIACGFFLKWRREKALHS
jgi:YjbE family integral membrane protein